MRAGYKNLFFSVFRMFQLKSRVRRCPVCSEKALSGWRAGSDRSCGTALVPDDALGITCWFMGLQIPASLPWITAGMLFGF